MSCSLEIPDDFPSKWALIGCQQAGSFLGNQLFMDTIPRSILVTEGDCMISTNGIIGALLSCLINNISLYYLVVLLFPSILKNQFFVNIFFWGFIITITTILPSVLSLIFMFMNQSGYMKNKEDTTIFSQIAFYSSVICIYGSILLMSIIYTALSMSISNGIMFLILIIGLYPIAKWLFPTLVLLFGPGSIPVLAGSSFLDYCS